MSTTSILPFISEYTAINELGSQVKDDDVDAIRKLEALIANVGTDRARAKSIDAARVLGQSATPGTAGRIGRVLKRYENAICPFLKDAVVEGLANVHRIRHPSPAQAAVGSSKLRQGNGRPSPKFRPHGLAR